MNDAYSDLVTRLREISRLNAISSLLDWDQETYMPPRAAAARADQQALIAGLAHERLVCDEFAACLDAARADDADPAARTNIREARRVFDRQRKLPRSLVEQIAHASSSAKTAWAQARGESNFALFAPALSRLLDLKKEAAARIGFPNEPYEALMDEFEPGATVPALEPVFTQLREATVQLLARIRAAGRQPDESILVRNYPRPAQEELTARMAALLQYDLEAGRIDVSTHPFCTTIGGPTDVRITTRYNESFISPALFGTLHETGHALYEQGLQAEHAGTPMGEAVSLGIHESQSRLWENMVGRSRAFWEGQYPSVQGLFPEALGDVSLDAFWRAINAVRPSMIRVEADELTYNLHIIVRFELERGMLRGDVEVGDIPAAWNEKMKSLLGIVPADDREGCLQDIHWSMGAFGYFPTYTLGNLYAAQFFETARAELDDLDGAIRRGDTRPLLDWLRRSIHRHGQRYRAHELVQVVTGKPLSIEPLLAYLRAKYGQVYGL
ncbi:MAG: carboxypeptidase M32 [Phycisphaerales bacterium]|nr:MAG: carboxypeptidase M32 [Phycisphaerales bacterium]